MFRIKKILLPFILIVSILFSQVTYSQQDINFSQFYELPLLRNPALAGVFNGNVRFTAAYRNQWESITTPYRTMAMSAEVKVFKGLSSGDFFTVGLQATNDVAGDSKLKRTQLLPVLNYHKLLNEDKNTLLALAFMGGPVGESFDPSKLQFDDQFVNGSYSNSNPTGQTFNKTSFSYLDASTGLSLTSFLNDDAKFYIGAGLFHFNNPKLSFLSDNTVTLNRKWVFNAGLSIYYNAYSRVVFYADYFMQGGDHLGQGGFMYTKILDTNGEEEWLSVSAGAAYRWKDAFIPVVKLTTRKLNIGLSYDTNISKLKTASKYRGGFELTLSYTDLWQSKNSSPDNIKCPINLW